MWGEGFSVFFLSDGMGAVSISLFGLNEFPFSDLFVGSDDRLVRFFMVSSA